MSTILEIANYYVNSHAYCEKRTLALHDRIMNESMPDDRRRMVEFELHQEQKKLAKFMRKIDQMNGKG